MKLPWSASKERAREPVEKNPKPTNNTIKSNEESPTLKVDGVDYEFNTLPEEIKGLVREIKSADNQVRICKDTIKILTAGRKDIY